MKDTFKGKYMNDLISVIVPVYNVEKYLDRCVQSIVDQTYKNLEIILVDDGSTDNSASICDNWAEKDNRIKVIHQPNMGGGAARNAALDIAEGEYITFVDSDDYISSDMYGYLYNLMSDDIDIAECSYISVQDDFEKFELVEDKTIICSAEEAMKYHIQDKIFKQVIWNKLYKKTVIADIRFPVGTKIDDEYFTYKVIGNSNRRIHSKKVCYAYRQHCESVMHSVNLDRCMQSVESRNQRYNHIKDRFPSLKDRCLNNLWFTCIYQLQLGNLYLNGTDFKTLQTYVKNITIDKSISLKEASFKEKIWLVMAKISLSLTCWVRNKLKIGL